MTRPVLLTIFALVGAASGLAQKYTAGGEFLLPDNFRGWPFVTSGFGMGYPEEGPPGKPLFENIFVNPEAARQFLKTGTWPDKTILLMELRDAGSLPSLNKDSRFQTGFLGVEAHVKDASRGGWTFYLVRKDARSGKAFPKSANCYSCHEKNGATDTTFVQYYPTLIPAAKRNRTFKESHE